MKSSNLFRVIPPCLFLCSGVMTNAQEPRNRPISTKVVKVTNPSVDSAKVLGTRNNTSIRLSNIKIASNAAVSVKYAAYKNGLTIPAKNLGSQDEKSLFEVTINNSWSVSSGAIALEPGQGLIGYNLKLENGKKYMVKLVYNKNHTGALKVTNQLSIMTYSDFVNDEVDYTLNKTPNGKNEQELTFIIAPYLYDDFQKKQFTAGSEVSCLLRLSLTNEYLKEANKNINHDGSYNMNVFKLVIKEIEF
jgi:hypothetical protein